MDYPYSTSVIHAYPFTGFKKEVKSDLDKNKVIMFNLNWIWLVFSSGLGLPAYITIPITLTLALIGVIV